METILDNARGIYITLRSAAYSPSPELQKWPLLGYCTSICRPPAWEIILTKLMGYGIKDKERGNHGLGWESGMGFLGNSHIVFVRLSWRQ